MTSRSVPPDAVSLVWPPVTSRSEPGSRTVTGMASLPKRGAKVSLASVGDQHDDTPDLFPRDRYGCGHRGAPGDAAQDVFLAREQPGHRDRLIGVHHDVRVDHQLAPARRSERA